jgi:predicted transcriptional regulator
MARDRQIAIRLSNEEFESLSEAARREDVPASIIIRGAIRNELERLKKAWEAKRRMGAQGFYHTADGKKYHMEFNELSKDVMVSGPWPTSPLRGPGTLPVKHYKASSVDEAQRRVAEALGPGEFI